MSNFTRRDLLPLAAGGLGMLPMAPQGAVARDRSGWPPALTLATASVGGTFFVCGQVLATLVGQTIGMSISTQQTHRIRALFPLHDTAFHFVALKGSGIASVAQLAGKRVGVGPRAGTPGTYFPAIFKTLGLDVTVTNGQAADMASQLGDGLIDCFAFAAGLPFPAYAELEATNTVTFFSLTDAEIARPLTAMPELSKATVPAGTCRTLAADQPTIGVFNFAIARDDLPETPAFAIVEAIHANHAELIRGHAAAKETLPQNVDRNSFLPFHPGAARYYREKGIAIPEKLVGA